MALTTRPKRTPSHKKRTAKHHSHSRGYLKSYWPYLPMLLIVGMGLLANSIWSNSSAVLGASSDFSSTSLLNQTNLKRAENNLPGLSLNPNLNAAAQAKANDLVAHNYWAHNSPQGKTPWSFITEAGYQYQSAGENLAYGFKGSSETITGWMNSPEHRENILNTQYQNVGFGVATSPNYQGHGPETIIVAEYAQPTNAVANVSFTVNDSAAVKAANQSLEASPQKVSRIQLLAGGNANWSLAVASAVAGAALMLFIVRHGLRLRRLIREGESFVTHHPVFDIAMVLIFMAGFVLTRTSGITH